MGVGTVLFPGEPLVGLNDHIKHMEQQRSFWWQGHQNYHFLK